MGKLEKLKSPDIKYWPDVRWWLAEGFHTDETLKKEIADLHDTGFGAVEFLAMEEPGADSKLYGWGSEEWVHDSHTVVEETTKRKMGVSMTSGTNWSNANLITITPDDKAAAKELDYAVETLKAGETKDGEIIESTLTMPGVTKQELEAVVAIRICGEEDGKTYLDKDSAAVLTDKVQDGKLVWTAPEDGDYLLFYFWIHGTGQTAEPSVSVSYTINYIDKYGVEAFINYWENTVLTPELTKNVEENGRAMMYMDSLELGTFGKGGQFWGYHFREEFEKRRGYDLTPYLPFILKEPGMMQPVYNYYYFSKDEVFTEKLLNDLYQTMTDMYMDNMLKPMQEWLHTHNMTLRAEISYGLPFEISQPGKYVDGIETESLEFASQIESYRNLAGPAHIYNRVYSSIRGSEASTHWPGHEGMWPIFSERFGERQPAFRHYKEWTAMLARYQMILRQGKPRMDLGIVRLDYNFNNMIFTGDEREIYENQLMRGNEGIYWKDMLLQNAGYTWDYFAPQLLEEDFVDYADGELLPDGPGYRALILYQNVLPLKTAEKLLELAKKGLPILFVNGVNETLRPFGVTRTYEKAAAMTPFNDGGDERLEQIVEEMKALPCVREVKNQADTYAVLMEMGIRPRAEFAQSNKNILTHMQEDEGKLSLFAYNMQYTEKEPFSFTMKVCGEGKVYRVDCWNGEAEEACCYKVENGYTLLTLSLAPGEACLYVIDRNEKAQPHVVSADGCKVVKTDDGFAALAAKSGEYEVVFSDGSKKNFSAAVPEDIPLPVWNLEVESWDEGDKKEIIEDRGLGIVTKEVYYETKKDIISVGETELKPWKDMEKLGPKVSGIGCYTTKATFPGDWSEDDGAILKIGDINKHTAAVYVNGQKAKAVNFDLLEVDISDLLKAGENEIKVEVSSSLNNRLLSRGYYEQGKASSMALADNANNANVSGESSEAEAGADMAPLFDIHAEVKDYGMVGEVKLVTYKKVKLVLS
ncbi:MAG: hypothetical protein NC400_07710 [Clostridium sp.]|nr:hypothetical protein [Clostridium sp.]